MGIGEGTVGRLEGKENWVELRLTNAYHVSQNGMDGRAEECHARNAVGQEVANFYEKNPITWIGRKECRYPTGTVE